MKTVGAILIGVGLAFSIFFLYTYIKGSKQLLSPIPENSGIKVIIISPTK